MIGYANKQTEITTLYLNIKELSLCHKLWIFNPYIFGTQCHKSLIFHIYIIWSNKSHSLKCQRFTTLESKDIWIRKSEFVAKTHFLCKIHVNKSPALFVECLKLWQRPGFGFISPTYINFFVALDTIILLMYCSCVKRG